MTIFENTLKLRGFLTADAEVPPSSGITEDAFAVLFLATMSGTWDVATNEWAPRITTHRIVCPGPWFWRFYARHETWRLRRDRGENSTSTTTSALSS